jgi:hypothetical protein
VTSGPLGRALATRSPYVKVFLALLAVVYLTVFPYLQAINNPNENTRTYLVMALVDHGTFRLDAVVKRYGWTNDMAKVPDAPAASGGGSASHLAAVKGPATAYLGVPVYAAQKAVLRLFGRRPPGERASAAEAAAWLRTTTITLQLFVVHVPCLLFLVWLERRLRRSSRDEVLRLSAVAAVGLGTNYLAYSFVFVSHALSAVAAFAALDIIAVARLRSRGDPARASARAALLAGLWAGAVTLLEYHAAVLSVGLALYALSAFRRPRQLGAFAAGASVSVALLALFQWRSFGTPLMPGHRMMENQAFGALMGKGFISFGAPDPKAGLALLFDHGFGLFGTSPYLWAAFAGAIALVLSPWGTRVSSRNRRREGLTAGALLAAISFSLSASVIWRGGWTIGPRYLGAAPPLLALLCLAAFEALARSGAPWRRELARALAIGLCVASFVQGGAIGLVVSTLPESIVRPVPQVLLPLLALRVVPHHALELLGVGSSWPFWLAPLAAAGALATLAVARAPSARALALRLAGASAVAALALVPALRLPQGEPDAGPEVRALFYSKWEPAGRDALALARLRASDDPCAWLEVARLEDTLGRPREATAARARAARSCPAR